MARTRVSIAMSLGIYGTFIPNGDSQSDTHQRFCRFVRFAFLLSCDRMYMQAGYDSFAMEDTMGASGAE